MIKLHMLMGLALLNLSHLFSMDAPQTKQMDAEVACEDGLVRAFEQLRLQAATIDANLTVGILLPTMDDFSGYHEKATLTAARIVNLTENKDSLRDAAFFMMVDTMPLRMMLEFTFPSSPLHQKAFSLLIWYFGEIHNILELVLKHSIGGEHEKQYCEKQVVLLKGVLGTQNYEELKTVERALTVQKRLGLANKPTHEQMIQAEYDLFLLSKQLKQDIEDLKKLPQPPILSLDESLLKLGRAQAEKFIRMLTLFARGIYCDIEPNAELKKALSLLHKNTQDKLAINQVKSFFYGQLRVLAKFDIEAMIKENVRHDSISVKIRRIFGMELDKSQIYSYADDYQKVDYLYSVCCSVYEL